MTEDGAVVGYDYGPEQVKLAYSPRLKTLVVSELPRAGLFGAESAYNFVEAFAVFAAKDDVAMEESTVEYEGRTVRAYEIEVTKLRVSASDGKAVAGLRMTVLAEPGTRRIVAASVEHQSRAGATCWPARNGS